MKRSNYDGYSFNDKKKHREKEWKREHDANGFRCSHCKSWVIINSHMGTANRNHCPHCLWSKHVDEKKGDREAICHGGMKPIGLTFKHEGVARQGEIMLVHECMGCAKLSINRIAGDDDNDGILGIFGSSKHDGRLAGLLEGTDVYLLKAEDEEEVCLQLFGRRW